jgi:hypothetical protein
MISTGKGPTVTDSSDTIMSGTGAGLVQFFTSMGDRGRLPGATSRNLKLAAQTVLAAVFDDGEGEWQATDVRTFDVEDVLHRFGNKTAGKYAEASNNAYKSRFSNGVEMYREFLKDPGGWKAPTKARAVKKSISTPKPVPGPPTTVDIEFSTPAPRDPLGATFISHTFPLRQGVRATLALPEDLTRREAKRIANFVESLAVDEVPALSAGEGG